MKQKLEGQDTIKVKSYEQKIEVKSMKILRKRLNRIRPDKIRQTTKAYKLKRKCKMDHGEGSNPRREDL